jgi:hypothetical protein
MQSLRSICWEKCFAGKTIIVKRRTEPISRTNLTFCDYMACAERFTCWTHRHAYVNPRSIFNVNHGNRFYAAVGR